jgi:hypothetical protein
MVQHALILSIPPATPLDCLKTMSSNLWTNLQDINVPLAYQLMDGSLSQYYPMMSNFDN